MCARDHEQLRKQVGAAVLGKQTLASHMRSKTFQNSSLPCSLKRKDQALQASGKPAKDFRKTSPWGIFQSEYRETFPGANILDKKEVMRDAFKAAKLIPGEWDRLVAKADNRTKDWLSLRRVLKSSVVGGLGGEWLDCDYYTMMRC